MRSTHESARPPGEEVPSVVMGVTPPPPHQQQQHAARQTMITSASSGHLQLPSHQQGAHGGNSATHQSGAMDMEGIDSWLSSGHPTHNNGGFLTEFDAPYTPSAFLDNAAAAAPSLAGGVAQPTVKHDTTFMSTSAALDTAALHASTTSMSHAQQAVGPSESAFVGLQRSNTASMPPRLPPIMTDDSHAASSSYALPSPTSASATQFVLDLNHGLTVDSVGGAVAASSMAAFAHSQTAQMSGQTQSMMTHRMEVPPYGSPYAQEDQKEMKPEMTSFGQTTPTPPHTDYAQQHQQQLQHQHAYAEMRQQQESRQQQQMQQQQQLQHHLQQQQQQQSPSQQHSYHPQQQTPPQQYRPQSQQSQHFPVDPSQPQPHLAQSAQHPPRHLPQQMHSQVHPYQSPSPHPHSSPMPLRQIGPAAAPNGGEMDYATAYPPSRSSLPPIPPLTGGAAIGAAQFASDRSMTSDSAASSPEMHMQGIPSSVSSTDHSSTHTSPQVSSPYNPPETPTQRHTGSPMPLKSHSPMGHSSRPAQPSSRASGHSFDAASQQTTNGLVSSLQSPTDILISVQLYAGTGKKKTWPTRLISLQSLHNPSLSYAQLLFHVANISTFVAVSVDGVEVTSAHAGSGLGDEEAGHVTSIQESPAFKARMEQIRAHLTSGRTPDDGALPAGSPMPHHRTPSAPSTPLDLPPLDVTYQLAENVKSCTRLGCMNLLVNKANRRACNICQSQGAEIHPNLLRRLILHPHHSPGQYAYLENILEEFDYWRFDSLDDHSITSNCSAANPTCAAFPFVNQVGYYIAFVDAVTAEHVQKDFNHKLGYTGSATADGNGSVPLGVAAPPMSTAICQVDTNFSYAIKMKSHFWMLEVKPKASMAGGTSTRLKSKFYKKVGKPNQSRATAAAAAMAAQQQAAAQAQAQAQAQAHAHAQAQAQAQAQAMNQPNPGFHSLVPFKQEDFVVSADSQLMPPFGRVPQMQQQQQMQQGQKRRFDDGPLSMPPMTHSESGAGSSTPTGGVTPPNLLAASSSPPAIGGAAVDLTPDGPTNTVHVTDASFRVMKNHPVSAMMSVHDTSVGTPAAGMADGIDSTPLVGQPTPVVLVYRDMDAYRRDVSMNGGGNGSGGGGDGSNGNGHSSQGQNGSGGAGGNDLGGGGGFSGDPAGNGANKRGRFDAGSGGTPGGVAGSVTNCLVPSGAFNLGGGSASVPLGLGGIGTVPNLNAASMAGVAAAVNQFQLAQAQAQMQQQLFQQVSMEFGRFAPPWVFQDRAAPRQESKEDRADGPTITLEEDDEPSTSMPSVTSSSRLSEHDAPFDDADEIDFDRSVRLRIDSGDEREDAADDEYSRRSSSHEGHLKWVRKSVDESLSDPLPPSSFVSVSLPKKVAPATRRPKSPLTYFDVFAAPGPAHDFFHGFMQFRQSIWGVLITIVLGLIAIVILVYNMQLPHTSDPAANALQLLQWNDVATSTSTADTVTTVDASSSKWATPQQPNAATHAAEVLAAMVTPSFRSATTVNTSDVMSHRLAASILLFSGMRDASSIFNMWAATTPTVVGNMLNPPPGTPATVNVDVIAANCNSGVLIGRAIGDFLLSNNGLLAAFGFLAAPPTLAPTLTASTLCSHLSTDIGPLFMYQLTCVKWLKGNQLAIPLPSTLSCASATVFAQAFTQNVCVQLMETISAENMTNVFFSPYNTTLSSTASPTVYLEDETTTSEPATRLIDNNGSPINSTNATTTAFKPLSSAAQTTLLMLPHLAAISFYTQASDLRSLCLNFSFINTIYASGPSSSHSSSSTSTDSTTSTAVSTTSTGRTYHANGILFGLIAIGSLGILLILQMILFVSAVGVRSLVERVRCAATPSHTSQPTRKGQI